MKIVVFGPGRRTGVLRGGEIVDIAGACGKYLREREGERNPAVAEALAPSDLGRFIEGGRRALDHAASALDYLYGTAGDHAGAQGEQLVFDADEVALHAPRPAGARVACAGGNFAAHAIAMAQRRTERGEANPIDGDATAYVRKRGFWGFWKVDRESLGQDGRLPYPARATHLDYEGEVAIVLGRGGKNIRAGDIKDLVWGVTLLGDWSIRMSPEGGPLSFGMQKNFDNSCSIGPCIAVDEVDALAVDLETRVNGEARQRFRSGEMAFSYGEYLEYLSRDFTFHPGDILSGGTGAGTAADSSATGDDGKPLPALFLKPGDLVEIVSPQIGTLRTHIAEPDRG